MARKGTHDEFSGANQRRPPPQLEGRAAPWTPFRDLLGFDPFHTLHSNWAYDYDVSRTEPDTKSKCWFPGINRIKPT